MSHYRKVDVRIWNDAKFQSLSDIAKLCFFQLLTHPNMTALGAMRATPEGLSSDLKDFREGFPEAFREVLSKGMADYDEDARLIALPNFVKYNPPNSPNVVKAWVGALEYIPESHLKTVVVQRAVAFTEGMSKGFRKAIPQALRDAMGDGMRYPLSTEHRDYLIQGGEFSEVVTTGNGGSRPALEVFSGGTFGGGDEL